MAWLAGWARRKAITLSTPAALLSAFPFPARITADTDVGALAQATGYDIRFTASDGTTLLDHERDTFAVTAGAATGLWWVEIPSWSALVATTIYMYYGKADAPDVSSGPNTFDANHVGVYHGGDGTTLSVQDSSQAGNHGTNNGATAAAGIAGGAMSFDGASQSVSLGNPVSLQITGSMTISGWAQLRDGDASSVVAKDASSGGRAYTLDYYSGQYRFYINGSVDGIVVATATYSALKHVVGVYDQSVPQLRIYLDGALVQDATAGASIPSATAACYIARREYTGNEDFLNGVLDEIRISNIARAPAWIAAEYGTIAAPATWQTWGAEESNVTARPWLYTRRTQIIGAGA